MRDPLKKHTHTLFNILEDKIHCIEICILFYLLIYLFNKVWDL